VASGTVEKLSSLASVWSKDVLVGLRVEAVVHRGLEYVHVVLLPSILASNIRPSTHDTVIGLPLSVALMTAVVPTEKLQIVGTGEET